jgi:hypothetical protein
VRAPLVGVLVIAVVVLLILGIGSGRIGLGRSILPLRRLALLARHAKLCITPWEGEEAEKAGDEDNVFWLVHKCLRFLLG